MAEGVKIGKAQPADLCSDVDVAAFGGGDQGDRRTGEFGNDDRQDSGVEVCVRPLHENHSVALRTEAIDCAAVVNPDGLVFRQSFFDDMASGCDATCSTFGGVVKKAGTPSLWRSDPNDLRRYPIDVFMPVDHGGTPVQAGGGGDKSVGVREGVA